MVLWKRALLGFVTAFIMCWLRAFSAFAQMLFFGFHWGPLPDDKQWYFDVLSPVIAVSSFPLSVIPENANIDSIFAALLQAYIAGFLVGYLWPPSLRKLARSSVWVAITGALMGEIISTAVLITASPALVTKVWNAEMLVVPPFPFLVLSCIGIVVSAKAISSFRYKQHQAKRKTDG